MLNVRKESIGVLRLKRKVLQLNLILWLFFQSLWNARLQNYHDTHTVTCQLLPVPLIFLIFFVLMLQSEKPVNLSVLKVETEQEE